MNCKCFVVLFVKLLLRYPLLPSRARVVSACWMVAHCAELTEVTARPFSALGSVTNGRL